jgi:hypothetical protein
MRVSAAVTSLCLLAGSAHAQRVPTLPGAWPLTGAPPAGEASLAPAPLPDRSLEIPRSDGPALLPGVDISAGEMFGGTDPTRPRDTERIRPSDRTLPREAGDQPRAVPGVTITVPLGQ